MKKSRFNIAKTRKKSIEAPSSSTTMEGSNMSAVEDFYGKTRWAWQRWIPIGLLTMFAGPQGTGKSYLMANVIAVLTGAELKWPDGRLYLGETGPVILIETEHMRGEYVERMRRLGIKNEMLSFPVAAGEDVTYVVDLTKDMNDVGILAHEIGAVGIIIDSLSGGHAMDENSDKMRLILKNLSDVAGLLQIPLILVHHTRKKSASESSKVTVDRVRGSSTITQFCRSVVGMFRLLNDQVSPVRVEVIKASLCKPPKPFGFTIEDDGLNFSDAPKFERKITKVEIAMDFLITTLADGAEKDSTVLRKRAAALGIKKRPLYDAADNLNIIKVKGMPWKLPTIDGVSYPVTSEKGR